VPQNKRRFQRHECSDIPRNQARRVVSNRATLRDRSTVAKRTCRSGLAFAAIHNVRDWILVFLRLRIELDTHGIEIDITKKDLNLKEVLRTLFLNGRGAESQCGPMFRQFSLPGDEIGSR